MYNTAIAVLAQTVLSYQGPLSREAVMTKYLLHQGQNNQSWLRKWSLTQRWLNIYHKLNNIFRLVLCWFEGSQSGNNDNVILYVARHHLPTDFLVFWHWQIQPRVCILNLPREENKSRVQALAQRLPEDLVQSSRKSVKRFSFQQTPIRTEQVKVIHDLLKLPSRFDYLMDSHCC